MRHGPGRRVYLDETGFERAAYRPWAWAPKGRKVFGERNGRSRPRTNLIAATAKGKRLFAPLLFEGNLNASYSITTSKNNCSSNLSLAPCSSWIMPPFTKLGKPGNSLRKADTSYSFFLPILPISTRLKNTSQTSKKFALISRQTLLLTTLFDCTDINDFYYNP